MLKMRASFFFVFVFFVSSSISLSANLDYHATKLLLVVSRATPLSRGSIRIIQMRGSASKCKSLTRSTSAFIFSHYYLLLLIRRACRLFWFDFIISSSSSSSSRRRHALFVSLPFGRDVLLLLGERSEAVVSEESPAVAPHEALDALTPPAGVSVAAALEHQRPADRVALKIQARVFVCLNTHPTRGCFYWLGVGSPQRLNGNI